MTSGNIKKVTCWDNPSGCKVHTNHQSLFPLWIFSYIQWNNLIRYHPILISKMVYSFPLHSYVNPDILTVAQSIHNLPVTVSSWCPYFFAPISTFSKWLSPHSTPTLTESPHRTAVAVAIWLAGRERENFLPVYSLFISPLPPLLYSYIFVPLIPPIPPIAPLPSPVAIGAASLSS